MTLAYITHDDCIKHDMGEYHPESPARLAAINSYLQATGQLGDMHTLEAQIATNDILTQVHPQAHVDAIMAAAPSSGVMPLDGDTLMCPDSLRAALLAAGSMQVAIDGLADGSFNRAFCAVRPPGHHAEASIPMGFCFFNNIALGVRYAQEKLGIKRAVVLDFDVHHGNGTVDIFKDDPDVMVCSSFQHPFYPGRYSDSVADHIVNTPLPAGTASLGFRRAIESDWLPALEKHQPEIIFVSAGFDAHRLDPLGGLELTEEDYQWVTELIVDAANSYSEGRVVAALEGGYDLQALARSVSSHLAALL